MTSAQVEQPNMNKMTQETNDAEGMSYLDEYFDILQPKNDIADETMMFKNIMKCFRFMVEDAPTKKEKISGLEKTIEWATTNFIKFPAHVHSKTTMAYVGVYDEHFKFEDVPEAMYPATLYYPLLTAEQREKLSDEDKEEAFREEEAYHDYVRILEQAKESKDLREKYDLYMRLIDFIATHRTPFHFKSITILYHLGLLSLKDE